MSNRYESGSPATCSGEEVTNEKPEEGESLTQHHVTHIASVIRRAIEESMVIRTFKRIRSM